MKNTLIVLGLLALAACSQNPPARESSADTAATPASSLSAPPGKPCQTVKDCHGATPKFCVACPAGTTGGCAHWACIENTCQIKTCE